MPAPPTPSADISGMREQIKENICLAFNLPEDGKSGKSTIKVFTTYECGGGFTATACMRKEDTRKADQYDFDPWCPWQPITSGSASKTATEALENLLKHTSVILKVMIDYDEKMRNLDPVDHPLWFYNYMRIINYNDGDGEELAAELEQRTLDLE